MSSWKAALFTQGLTLIHRKFFSYCILSFKAPIRERCLSVMAAYFSDRLVALLGYLAGTHLLYLLTQILYGCKPMSPFV